MAETYKCRACGGIFKYARSHEEALAEMKRDFGDVPEGRQVVICDNCYQNLKQDIEEVRKLLGYIEDPPRRTE